MTPTSPRLICQQCGGTLTPTSAPELHGPEGGERRKAVNVDWSCETHGLQFTVSTRIEDAAYQGRYGIISKIDA